MTCLLGVCDVAVSTSSETCYQTNKIGGTPDWPGDTVLTLPNCQVCGRLQSLVVQLYCCLEKSKYHRTLYLFACCNPQCWNKGKSWTVYRCQTEDPVGKQSTTQVDSRSSSSTTARCPNDDWGVAGDDWGVAGDDWGVASDDWGESLGGIGDVDDWGGEASDNDFRTDRLLSENEGRDLPSASKMDFESTKTGQDEDHDTPKLDVLADCASLKQLCIHDISDDTATGDSQTDVLHVVEEDLPSMSEQEKLKRLQSFQVSSETETVVERVLSSYFINVFEEPAIQDEHNGHVTKLLKDYEKREGYTVKEILNDVRVEKGSKTEKYEKSALLHKDLVFHKFMKTVSLCPTQCVRYEWNGSPLFNSHPTTSIPSCCCHCGGEVVFELQLTPALINHLRFPNKKEPALEFGTVLVYTCKQSCWDSSVMYRTEEVVVQPDPDQQFFK